MDSHLRFSYDHVIRDLEVPAFVAGLQRRIIIANAKAARLISLGAGQDLVGATLNDLFSTTDTLSLSAWIDAGRQGQPVPPRRTVFIAERGGPRLWSVLPLKDQDRTPVGLLFQQVQQTSSLPDLCPAEAEGEVAELNALTSNELRWKTAVLSAEQGVWDHDFEYDRHFLSDSWRLMRGIPIGSAVAISTADWLTTIHPDDLERVSGQLALQDSGQTDIINYTFRQRHAEGHWVWILSRGRVVRRDAEGVPMRIIGTDTDISDLKAVEQDRARLAERLQLAIEAAEMGQWELQVVANHAVWDDRALQMFGLDDGGNLRPENDWTDLIHPDDRAATVAYNDQCQRDRQDMACDYRIITPAGTEKYIRSRGKWVGDAVLGDRYIGVNLDLTQDYRKTVALQDALDRLEYESRHDALTGLANRRGLDEAFGNRMAYTASAEMAALHINIDLFKQINDSFGHDAGDFTLRHAATILRRLMPSDVLVARVGGDEFVVLFPIAPPRDTLTTLARQIIQTFGLPFFYADMRIKSGLSIGIVWTGLCDQPDQLLTAADIALYHAKKNGRATVRVYSSDMKDQARRRINIQDALISAFERDEIICYYQPQFETRSMALSGAEALVRWKSRTHGLVPPDRFMGVAEDMGLIATLDEIVLGRVLADITRWIGEGLAVPRISVNISAQRLMDPTVGTRLARMAIPPGRIVFELLESVFLDGENKIITNNLRLFAAMGIDVEIDDFGTGHASILSLLRIAPKRLKIDRELVQPIVWSPKRRELLATIVRIGQMLDIEVVAEGVETQAHIEILRELKCDYLQGYALARPMTAEDLRHLLAAPRPQKPGAL